MRRETLRDANSGAALEGLTVAVGPVTGTLFTLSLAVTFVQSVFVMVDNQDATQVFTGYLETAPSLAGPWARTGNTAFLDVDPTDAGKDPATETVQTADVPFIRLVGAMSGAGGDVEVWAVAKVVP